MLIEMLEVFNLSNCVTNCGLNKSEGNSECYHSKVFTKKSFLIQIMKLEHILNSYKKGKKNIAKKHNNRIGYCPVIQRHTM